MRRLPIYLVIDTSEAMKNVAGKSVTKGIEKFLGNLSNDPFTLEISWVSLIAFSEEARQLQDLQELSAFDMPDIVFGGLPSLPNALMVLRECIKREVIANSREIKGDYKPIVFLLINDIVEVEKKEVVDMLESLRGCRLIICPPRLTKTAEWLSPVSDAVLLLDNFCSDAVRKFLKCVSCSLKTNSAPLDPIPDDESLPPRPPIDNITLVP